MHEFDTVTVEELRSRGGLKWTMYGPESIGAFVAEMDFGAAPPILAALHASVDAMGFGYLPPALERRLTRACAAFHRERYGWDVPPEWVRPLPDVLTGLEVAALHLSEPGRPVILPTPAYMPFRTVPGLLGRGTIEVPMVRDGDRYVLDLDGIDAAFRAGGHLLVLTNPHNPLGRVFTAGELRALAGVVDRHGGRVFSDEIHAPLVYPGHHHVPYATVSAAAAAQAVTATSASKAWNLPGLKCAQLLLSTPADADRLDELGVFVTHGAANPGVVANIAAYEDGVPWLVEVLAYLDGSRRRLGELLAERLPEVGYLVPEGTYLAWLDLRALGLGDHPGEVIRERTGVALVDGPACGDPGRGHARLNFATPRPILERLVDGIAAAAHGTRPGT